MHTLRYKVGPFHWFGLIAVCALSVTWAWSGQPRNAHCERSYQPSTLIGAHRCKSCHQEAYRTWKNSQHAKSFSHLSAQDRKNPACLKCHTTGTATHLQGVQCESCHGGGKYYSIPEVMVDSKLARAVGLKVVRGKSGCVTCHRAPSTKLKKFHYPTQWKKIKHGSK